MTNIKTDINICSLSIVLNDIAIDSLTQCKLYRINNNRFSCARFPCQYSHTVAEIQFDLINAGTVAGITAVYAKRLECHGIQFTRWMARLSTDRAAS